MGYLDND